MEEEEKKVEEDKEEQEEEEQEEKEEERQEQEQGGRRVPGRGSLGEKRALQGRRGARDEGAPAGKQRVSQQTKSRGAG